MLQIRFHSRFEKDYRALKKRGLPVNELWKAVKLLQDGKPLEARYRDHRLIDSGEYLNVRECHIRPDWLLIYQINREELVLLLLRTGTHSDLF